MQADVYADILFLINFSMDYLCLYITARVLHLELRIGRAILAASAGGIYSIFSLFISASPLLGLILDCAVCFAICCVCFAGRGGKTGKLFLISFLYVGISMMTGGCMTAIFNLLNKLDLPLDFIGDDGFSTYLFAILAAIAGVISLKSGQMISKKSAVKECRVSVRFCGEDFVFHGFSDSGNMVRDPLSGRPVIFLDRGELEAKCSLSFLDSFASGTLPKDIPVGGLRIISLRTATGSSTAVAARPEALEIEYTDPRGRSHTFSPDALIAATDIGKSAQGYNAIVPSEIITQ
jgi:sigma-E processing peptidase SpoIIGA